MQAVKLFIFFSWIVILGIFIHGQGYFNSSGRPEGPGIEDGDYNYIVYFRENRTGEINISKQDNHLNVEGGLSFHSFGQYNNLSFRGLAILSDAGEAESFIIKLFANDQEASVKGAGYGDGMKISLVSDEVKTSFIANNGLSLSNVIFPGLTPSEDIKNIRLMNPLTGRNEPVSVTFEGERTIGSYKLNKFSVRQKHLTSKIWTCMDGNIVMAVIPPGFRFVEASKARKIFPEKHEEDLLPDLAAELKIQASVPVENDKDIKEAVFKLGGIDPEYYRIHSPRQSLKGNNLTIRRQRSPEKTVPFPVLSKETEPFLLAEPLIDSSHPDIVRKAAELTSGAECAWEAAKKINTWLFENIDKKYSPGIPSSAAVLHSMGGDCNEHTFLFIALARSAGIPAKACIGLACYEGNFYYHAWPMVYVGEWVEMDPTLGMQTVGATHVKLIEGGLSEQMKLAGLSGNIQLKLKGVRYDTDQSPEQKLR